MKKLFKVLTFILCAAMLCGLAACGGGKNTDGGGKNTDNNNTDPGGDGNTPGGVQTYVMEAEYIDLDGLVSPSYSGSIGGTDLVYGSGSQEDKDKGWSNGYYVGPTYSDGFTLNFVFTADSAESANLVLRLGSEIENTALNSSNFSVKVNDTAVNFGTISVTKSTDMAGMVFYDKNIPVTVNLVAGQNTISLTVLANSLRGGDDPTGGPMVDCVKIKTKAVLTWEIVDNPSNIGQV
jgi:hypothetical protein